VSRSAALQYCSCVFDEDAAALSTGGGQRVEGNHETAFHKLIMILALAAATLETPAVAGGWGDHDGGGGRGWGGYGGGGSWGYRRGGWGGW